MYPNQTVSNSTISVGGVNVTGAQAGPVGNLAPQVQANSVSSHGATPVSIAGNALKTRRRFPRSRKATSLHLVDGNAGLLDVNGVEAMGASEIRHHAEEFGEEVPSDVFYSAFKSSFDMVGSLAILSVTAPLFPIIAGVVKATSRGPVIFRQQRLTKGGREFTIYKFRTMNANAEARSGAVWAEKDDPRVTRVGNFLRITRLDELPQLFNVLRGDMSLIGPRPERPEFAKVIGDEVPGFHRRLRVKAGLTGLAQVRAGYSACMDGHRKKLAWDLLYIRRRSMLLDCWIVLKTVTVMLNRRGAR